MKILIYIILFLGINLYGAYGIQLGSYNTRPSIPLKIQQLQLPTKIINKNGKYKLIVGPFKTSLQANQAKNSFNLDGFILEYAKNTNTNTNIANQTIAPKKNLQQTNKQYAVEILSTKDINLVPKRILDKIMQMNLDPSYIMDKGLYRLIVGPISNKLEAQKVKNSLSTVFGVPMSVISADNNKFALAYHVSQTKSNNLNIKSNDKAEHLQYLESQRKKAVKKYNIKPFGPTKVVKPYDYTQTQQPKTTLLDKSVKEDIVQQPINLGVIFSTISMSSKNSLMVNGKKIGGEYSVGGQMGMKFGDNTIFQFGYVTDELKETTVYLSDKQLVNIKSKYSLMMAGELKYRYFLPTINSLFITANFGMSFVKQDIISQVPINFGKAYTYEGWYLQPYLGFGFGIRFVKSLSVNMDYNTYFTLKTMSTNVKFSLNYEI